MILFLCSIPDPASLNIRDRLLEIGGWVPIDNFDDEPVYRWGNALLASMTRLHLHADDIDVTLRDALGLKPDVIVFLSKHESASRKRTLTVHPIGNFSDAQLGGQPKTLVPAASHHMTAALRGLKTEVGKTGIPYDVSFEATHHGPYLSTPSFFAEIGSDAKAWTDPQAGRAVAGALMSALKVREETIAIGVGGGHYAPRHTEVALRKNVSFGHIIPRYQPISAELVDMMIGATPGVEWVHFHGTDEKERELFESRGLLSC